MKKKNQKEVVFHELTSNVESTEKGAMSNAQVDNEIEESVPFIKDEDKDKVIKVLEVKKALLSKWYGVMCKMQAAIKKGEDADSYFDDVQSDDDDVYGHAYIIGCVDEDENGISVFPNWRGQVTLHKYHDGSWG